MNRLGIHIPDYGIEIYRKINDDLLDSNILSQRKKIKINNIPNSSINYTPIPDNREQILKNMRKDIDKALEIKIDPRPIPNPIENIFDN